MAGIYRNQTEGIISLSSDGTTRITIADKNLGATSTDITSTDSYGYYYQWGNNYGFSTTGAVTTSGTPVDATAYGPGNYYSSSTFITASSSSYGYYWQTTLNANLRGGVTGTNEAKQGPCPSGFHIMSTAEANTLKTVITTLGTTYDKILMPLAGQRAGNSTRIDGVGSYGYWWTSDAYNTAVYYAYNFYTNGNTINVSDEQQGRGCSIRPFKNEAVIPDRTWTKLYGDDIPEPQTFFKRFIKNGNYYYFGDAPIHISGLSLDKSSISLTTVGQTEQLTATISPADAVETNIVWSSSDETIATVSQTGLVTCVTPGECTITATCGGYSASCSVVERIDVYADFLLVGGGGHGGRAYSNTYSGGGGGAGGYIECNNYLINAGSYSVVVGGGGQTLQSNCNGSNGGNSTFNGLTAYGGGGGGYILNGCSGGSGGGGGSDNKTAGSGCSGQGNSGGNGTSYAGGGGGGANATGCTAATYIGGNGGAGKCSSISGACYYYAGGGAGGSYQSCTHYGGGLGSAACGCCGGGGMGGQVNCNMQNGGSGCDGVFILRYPTACGYDVSGGTCYTCGDYTIHCFTSDGTLTVN